MITLTDIDALAMPREQVLQHASDVGDLQSDTEALARIQAAIEYADGVVRSAYSKAKLQLPSSSDPVVKTVLVDIALYRIVTRRPGDIAASIASNYAAALQFLENVILESTNAGDSATTLTTFTRDAELINRFNAMP